MRFTHEMLDSMERVLRDRYVNHEISADEYAAHLETIKVSRRRVAR